MNKANTKTPAVKLDQRANFLALVLLDALEDENESDINSILEQNQVDASYVPAERGIAPLHFACGMKNPQLALNVTKRLLACGANANVRSSDDMTPLHVAAIMGREELVALLLKHGAQHDVQNSERKTPLHYAIEGCHFEVLQLLRQHMRRQKCDAQEQESTESQNTKQSLNSLDVNSITAEQPISASTSDAFKSVLCTPNSLHYNYDITSPYYINITHRRNKPQPCFPAKENNDNNDLPNSVSSTDPTADATKSAVNIFALTKANLAELSQPNTASVALDRSCIALIESWREKVQRSRARKSILRHFDDIDVMLNEVMKSEHLNFTNIVLRDEEATSEQEAEANTDITMKRIGNPNISLGTLIQKTAEAHLVNMEPVGKRPAKAKSKTVSIVEGKSCAKSEEHDKHKQQRKTSSAKAAEYFLQMTEAYVHTDDDHGLVFYETKLLSNPNGDYKSVSTDNRHNTVLDKKPNGTVDTFEKSENGEINIKSNKRLYIKRLIKYKRKLPLVLVPNGQKYGIDTAKYSVELSRTTHSLTGFKLIPQYAHYETQSKLHFANQHPKPITHEKQGFIYLLLDPRMSCNLPGERTFLDSFTIWKRFLHAIFYVGKGNITRPYAQLYDAMKLHSRLRNQTNESNFNARKSVYEKPRHALELFKTTVKKNATNAKQLQRILDIWHSGNGVVCLHVFHNILPAEAYTREAAIVDAIGLQHLCNTKRGDYYGPVQTWTMKDKKYLGIALLFSAMQFYLAEGESQLSPSDLI